MLNRISEFKLYFCHGQDRLETSISLKRGGWTQGGIRTDSKYEVNVSYRSV